MSAAVQPPREDPRAIRLEVERIVRSPPEDRAAIFVAGAAALRHGMAREADAMFSLALQTLRDYIARRDAARALVAEAEIYNTFVKAGESEEHYERCFSQWRDAMSDLGRAYARPLPPRPASSGTFRPAFVFHTGAVLGHTEVLQQLLAVRDRDTVQPRLYTIFGQAEGFAERAAAVGVPVEAWPGGSGPHDWLRERLAANGEDTAVWVTAPPASLFMFGARVAPIQVFWSLKYHPIRAPEIDGYVTYGAWAERERVFHGQRWTVCPVPFAHEPRPPPPHAVAELRARFPERVLLGTLAREEKIDSKPFLASVAELLRRHPQAGYVWTGRARHAGIESFFASEGVANRCHFVGWVDTPLYAAALDIFLETFPMGCGVTGYQALGAGLPLLSYLEVNTVFGMQYGAEVAASGKAPTREQLDEYPVLVARDPAEYVALASRLIEDTAFREAWRVRERGYYDGEIANTARYAKRFFDTLAAIEPRQAR